MSNTRLSVIVLAAGLGTRMRSAKPKVLHEIFGRPMLSYILDAANGLGPSEIIAVVSSALGDIGSRISLPQRTRVAIQKRQLGTANALMSALPASREGRGTVLVVNGDSPLITSSSLNKFLKRHRKARNSLSIMSFDATDPHGYGRIERGPKGALIGVVEEKDATREQRLISEVNSGVYALEPPALRLLGRIRKNAKKGEYYLTDIAALALGDGLKVGAYPMGLEEELMGINSRQDLMMATETMRSRAIDSLMTKGVTFIDSFTAYISPEAGVGRDTVIYPNVYIHGQTSIGRGCTIYPNTRIYASRIKDGAVIKDSSLIEDSTVGRDAQVGPMAHLRPGSVIGDTARIGNFVEVKKSSIGKGTKAMHLSYIGDATVGSDANIGAGTITCNYDGKKKHPTIIGNRAFIGSDTQLVAPVSVGDDAYVGAGSTITREVEPGTLAVSRSKQRNYKRHLRGKAR